MRRLLFVGDAGCESGFAKATHHILEEVRKTWDVVVLGLNYRGDPHKWPYPIHPAFVPGGDLFGVRRLLTMCDAYHPDTVVIQNDPWNIPAYTRELHKLKTPPTAVGIIAVDGLNCRGDALNGLQHAIFWTRFAQAEAVKGGMTIPSGIAPLGVDLNVFYPQDMRTARTKLGLPQDIIDGFVVGNINRNQPRKRLDLTIRYFANWYHTWKRKDAFLYLHVAPTGDFGFDCQQLAKYYNIGDRLILAEPEMYHGTPEHWVATTLNSFDVQMTTTQGEGWGLTTMEGMACGVPQVVPQWAALEEWCAGAAWQVECTSTSSTPKVNVVGGIACEESMTYALNHLYKFPALRDEFCKKGIALVAQDKYRWQNVATRFADEIDIASRPSCGMVDLSQPCPAVPA